MISPVKRLEAKRMFLKGATLQETATAIGISYGCLKNWAAEEKWGEDTFSSHDNFMQAQLRLNYLITKDEKTSHDFKELHILMTIIERLHKQKNLELQPKKVVERNHPEERQRTRKNRKNDLSQYTEDEILEKFEARLFDYQFELFENIHQRTRNILKSRQIGLTWYFAREAFVDALLSGDNQIFISASRAQADVFKQYIKECAREWFGAELTGKDRIEITTRKGIATFYFLSTSSTTAQSYHGHLYIDEYFWIPRFDQLNKVASAMASHKKWRKTYFSTPSAKSHSAYPFWTGDLYNDRHKSSNKALIKFPDFKELQKGKLCPDGQYRKIITIEDAIAGGCNLFDLNQLKLEYSEEEFRQLFMCEFIDDTACAFKLSDLEKAITDRTEWRDFHPDNDKPYLAPVWIGYDPSRVRDGACIVVVAPPLSIGGKFRVLERIKMVNQAWQYQVTVIKELTEKYRVEYIGIDITGPGAGVFEQVQQFFPCATPIYYTQEIKTRLVLKAQQVLIDNRILWDAAWSDIGAGFLQIKKTITGSGSITYIADRSDRVGHADAAWAIMHVLINEGLLLPGTETVATVVIG